jgi:hypothetical protein
MPKRDGRRCVIISSIVPSYRATKIVSVNLTAGWFSALVQTTKPEVPGSNPSSKGFCGKQLHLLTSHGCLYILLILACQQFLTESHIVTRVANELSSFLNMNDINEISFLERLTAIIVVL